LASFFAFFYFSINFGSFISEVLTPALRRDVGYWCAFGIPAVILLVSTAIFVAGKRHYKMAPVGENVLGNFLKVVNVCINILAL
jgi:dipeptide/tripeptide permease